MGGREAIPEEVDVDSFAWKPSGQTAQTSPLARLLQREFPAARSPPQSRPQGAQPPPPPHKPPERRLFE